MSGQITVSESLQPILARAIDSTTRARARLHLLDWLGCTIAGISEPGCGEVRRLAEREGAGACRIIGGGMVGPQAAALANGPPGAVLEMDDVDKRALLHPGPVVMPALLAVAQAHGVTDGARFLDAIVVGYEAMIRTGRAAGNHYRMFHPTATCGTFGAAAGAARLMGLNARQSAWALGNAGQQAAGLWQVRHEQVHTKALHDGRAAANGVAAALLAADNYAGPLAIFEGPQGFFPAMCPGGDPQAILADPEADWAIHEVSFKPHAACRHAHAVIDAVLAAVRANPGRPVAAIDVASYADALIFCRHTEPTTAGEAKFSLAHAAAAAAIHGHADLPLFTAQACHDPAVAALRPHVTAIEDPAITALYPAHFGARAAVRFADGGRETVAVEDALGDPEKPLDAAALEAKARALFAWGELDAAVGDALVDTVLHLGEGSDLAALFALLPAGSA
jgi:2-methylcitrate dehydratase PrpD